MTMTSIAGSRRFSSRVRCRPSPSGSIRSTMAACESPWRTAVSASRTLPAVRTPYPSLSRVSRSPSAIVFSSSTTRMEWFRFMVAGSVRPARAAGGLRQARPGSDLPGLPWRPGSAAPASLWRGPQARASRVSIRGARRVSGGLERKTRLDPRAVAQATRHRELPGMQVDHRARDRHSEPGAVRLRGEEEIEGTRERFLGHARTGVLDGHGDGPGRRGIRGGDGQPARALERLERVEDQVQERLAQLALVELRRRARWVVRSDDLDSVGRTSGAGQLQTLVEQRGQRRRLAMELGRPAECGDLGDDARQMIDRIGDLAGEISRLGVARLGEALLEVVHVEP